MLNTQKTINAEKYNEWVRKFSEQIFKITGDENVAKNELEPWTPEGTDPNYCWWRLIRLMLQMKP